MAIAYPSQPIFGPQPKDYSDVGIAFRKGARGLRGQMLEILPKSVGGEFLRGIGLEEQGNQWLSDAYASGILMGMDLNELDQYFEGPRTLSDISDANGALAYGINAFAEQVPTLMAQFAPAVATVALRRFGAPIPKWVTPASIIGTLGWMNTADVYTRLMMDAGESRLGVAAGTATLMTALDMLVPLRVINRMNRGVDFTKYIGKRLKLPDSPFRLGLAGAIEGGVLEGSTEYVQTIFENMALNYVKDNDLLQEFSEAQNEELREAGARGAIVGSILTGGVATGMGIKAARDKAKLVEKLKAFEEGWPGIRGALPAPQAGLSGPLSTETEPPLLPTMDLRQLTAPLDGALGAKIREAHKGFQTEDYLRAQEEAIQDIQIGWQIEDKKRVWKAILEGDMERGLDIADQNMLYDWTDRLLEERAIVGMQRELAPSELVTVPVERGQRRIGFAEAGDIPLFARGKKAEGGWYVTERNPLLTDKGTIKQKGKGRGDTYVNTYENDKYILKPETNLYGSLWVVIDKSSGKEVDRNKLQKVLMNKYATAPVPAGTAQAEQRLKSEDRIIAPWRQPYDTGTLSREEKAETQAQRHEQELGERGVLQAGINDKVRFYQLNEISGEWEYPNEETYTVDDIWYASGDVTGVVTRPETMRKVSKTLEEYSKENEGPVSVVFTLRRESDQAVRDVAISPTEDTVRIVPRLRSAWKIPQFFGLPIGEAERAMGDVRTEEDLEELYQYTPEGERFLIAKERGANLKRFRELIGPEKKEDKNPEQLAFWDRFVQALANAQIKRAENANANVIKYSAFRTEDQLREFIKNSNKTNSELGIPVPRRVIEEEEWVKRQAQLEAEDRLNEKERLALVKAGEARIEGMEEEEAVDIEDRPLPAAPEGELVTEVTTRELEGEPEADIRRPRRVWREFPEWKKLLRAREKELKRKSGGLTKEEINALRAEEWGDAPIGEMVVSTKAAPGTKAARRTVVGTAKTAITKRLKALNAPELERQQLEITRQMEARGIAVVQLEAHPKDASLFEVKDLETGALPAPETHEIKIKPEVAEEHGLNPGFFYPYMEAIWAGKKYKGFVNVDGQYIRRDDVVDLRNITGKAVAPEEGDFIELSTVIQVLRKGAVVPSYSLPDGIPGIETITKAWIDVKTGIIIVQREATIRMEDLERVDVDYEYDYEIYLTWYDREEHAVKLREVADRLLNIERQSTEQSRATGAYEKPERKMIKVAGRKIDLSKDKSIIEDRTIFKTKRIEVTVNPRTLARINRERRDFFFEERLPQSALHEGRARFRVMPVYGDKLYPIGKEGEQWNQRIPKTRKDLVRLVSWDGQSYVVNINSLENAYILPRDVPERVGVMIPYETLVEEGPSRGVRLIASFKGTIQEEATAMEEFMAEMFTPQTHAFGRFGNRKEKFLNARAGVLESAKGEQALVEFFDGTLMEGKIGRVRKKAGTFELITSKKEWKRELPIEIDILGYDRIQLLEKPPRGRFVAGKIKEISPSDRQYSNVVYVPALVPPTYFRGQTDSGLTLRSEEFPTLAKVGEPTPPDVEVVKGSRLGQPIYTITVDGRMMSDKVLQKEATTILNELYAENDQQLNVIAIPEDLRWDGYVAPEAPVEQNVVDVTSKEGLVTQIKLNMPVTIIHKGSKRKQEGKFVDFVYSLEDVHLGGTVHFLANKGKVMRRLLVKEIDYFYDVDALQAEKDQQKLEADIAKIEKVVAIAVKGKPKKKTAVTEPAVTEVTETVEDREGAVTETTPKGTVKEQAGAAIEERLKQTGTRDTSKDIKDEKGNVIFEGYKISKETQAKVNPPAADNKTKSVKEVQTTPIGNLKIPQRFKDSTGAEWEVSQHLGNMDKTVLKWVGGTKPDIKINFEFSGKRETLEWQENQEIIVNSKVAPTSIFTKKHKQTTFRGVTGEGISRVTSIEKGRYIPYFSIVRDSVGRGDRGRVSYNTGLTPKTFREVLAKRIGRLQLARLEKDGVIRIVQNQIDLPNPPNDMGVGAVVRDGQVWFVTNNIKEEDIGGVFAHEIGTHIGLLTVYGEDIHQYILDSARELRDSSDVWRDSFAAAETVYAKISASPELVSKEYQERWKNFTDEEAADFIAEEAVGYYTEATDPMSDSFWRMLLDMFLRGKARVKKWLGIKMNEAEIIAFIRGAIRGTINKKYDNIQARRNEYYSAAFGEGLTEKFYDYVNDKLRDHDSYRVQKAVASASNFRKKIGSFFNQLKYVPQEGLLRKLRSLTQGRLAEVADLGQEIKKTYAKLTSIQKEELYNFFTDEHAKEEIISDPKLRENSVKYKQIIMDIGLEAFRKGIIPAVQREKFEELFGAYLPRVFLYHLLTTKGSGSPFGFKPSPRWWSEERLELADLKRELLGEITDPAYLVYRAITIPQADMIILDFLETLSMAKAFVKDDKGRDLPPWVLPQQWVTYEFINPTTGKTMKRRTTVHALNNEIESFQIVRNHAGTSEKRKLIIDKEIAVLEEAKRKFYKDKGITEDGLEDYYNEKYDTKMFRQIPKTRRFGNYGGIWIRKEIYADILGNSATSFGEQNFFSKMFSPHGRHARLVGIFKMLNVPMNPPSVARNGVANMIALDVFGDIRLWKQPALLKEAFREAIKGERGTVHKDSITGESFTAYELAKKQGITATTMIASEINKMEAFLLDVERDGILYSWTKHFQKYWGKASDTAGFIYQQLEVIGKVAYINHALQHQRDHLTEVMNERKNLGPDGIPNVTIEDVAVQRSNDVLFDYSEVHPFVRGLRSSFFGAPFITYQVKVIPQLLKTLARHPTRFLPYIALFAGAQMAFGSMPLVDDDWDKLIKMMPEWIRDSGHGMIMPYKDEHGRWQAADLSYFFPWGAPVAMFHALRKGEFKEAVKEVGLIAPGWQIAVALLENKDTWGGYAIVDPNGTASDKAMDMFNFAWSMSMPSILGRRGLVNMPSLLEATARMDPSELEGKLFDAMMDKTGRYGDPKRDLTSALLSVVGFNTYPIAPDARGRQLRRYKAEVEGYKRSITKAKDDKSLSKSQETRRISALKDKIDEARKKRKEFAQDTAGVRM